MTNTVLTVLDLVQTEGLSKDALYPTPSPTEVPRTSAQGRALMSSARPENFEAQGKHMVLAGLQKAQQELSQQGEPARSEMVSQLVAGSSQTGFVRICKSNRRITTMEDLRGLIVALGRPTSHRVFGTDGKLLLFFAVPRGYMAFAGEVRWDALFRSYLKKDKAIAVARANWEKARDAAVAAGTPVPPEAPEYKETQIPGTDQKWGGWVTTLLNGTRVTSVSLPVMSQGLLVHEFHPVLVNTNAPLQQARTLTFVLDRQTGKLEAWQPGRFFANMTPAQRTDRVILASGETVEVNHR